ncbi:MAG: YihA family ribosome biogenesis GTP-binding protein, partial [Clostridium sp.]
IIATKSDKLSNNELRKNEKVIRDTLKLGKEDKLYFFSSVNKKGKDELIDNLFGPLVESETESE